MRQGRILAGKYCLVSKLTEGGMGTVWRAEHLELGTPAAVKLLDPTIAESPEALARFKREAQSAASLRSTNIVQIFDFGVDENLPYIAMEMLRGQSLAEKLRTQGPMSPADTAAVLSQVARAAAWAHSRGIVHRDLKPGNIFLSEDADDIIVKLLDFGIAKPVEIDLTDTPVTLTGSIMGTPQYMSPEQAAGRRIVDHRTDIWSFGIIAFECLTAKHVFRADTFGGLILAICTEPMPKPSDFGEVPPGFDEWFRRAAARDLSERFSSITEASDALRYVCGADTSGSNRISTYDVNFGAELRSINTPGRGIKGSTGDFDRTTEDGPSAVNTAPSALRNRRIQLLLFVGVLLVALTAVGSLLRHGGARQRTIPLSATVNASTAPSLSKSEPLAEPTEPAASTRSATQHEPQPSSSRPSRKPPPRGNPTAVPSVQPVPKVMPPTSAAAPPAGPPCDPEVKRLIGICPT